MSSTNSVLAGTMPMQQFDKSTMIKKKISDAQNYIAKGDYVAAQNTLNSLLKLDPNNSCLLYKSQSPRDLSTSRMAGSA